MTAVDELKDAMKSWRASRKGGGGRGKALFDLNRWKGEQRRALDEEYNRRLAEIEAIPEAEETYMPDEVLDLVAKAHREGTSRSAIRIALGKQSLSDADEVIRAATERFQDRVAGGAEGAYVLKPTGDVHGRGWPFYDVTLHETGETHRGLYLITPDGSTLKQAHLRIQPAPPGSQEILSQVWNSGAASEMFERGKGE